jgi:hypothetical protein
MMNTHTNMRRFVEVWWFLFFFPDLPTVFVAKSYEECGDPAVCPLHTCNMLQRTAISRATATTRLLIDEVAIETFYHCTV